MIETNHGIQLPALQHAVVSVFGREGITESAMDESDVARYINQLLLEFGNARNFSYNDYNLGRGVGLRNEYDFRERNPFSLLMPNTSAY